MGRSNGIFYATECFHSHKGYQMKQEKKVSKELYEHTAHIHTVISHRFTQFNDIYTLSICKSLFNLLFQCTIEYMYLIKHHLFKKIYFEYKWRKGQPETFDSHICWLSSISSISVGMYPIVLMHSPRSLQLMKPSLSLSNSLNASRSSAGKACEKKSEQVRERQRYCFSKSKLYGSYVKALQVQTFFM